MSLADIATGALAAVSRIKEATDGVRIYTHCIYPSNGYVGVLVQGGPSEYRVSDGGGALRDIESTGVTTENDPMRAIKRIAEAHGLLFSNGTISAPKVGADRLGITITIVANASKDAAEWFYATTKIRRRRNFKLVVRELLNKTFEPDQIVSNAVQGASSKSHNFDSVISLGEGKVLLVDAVVCDGNSINSAIASNVDVRERKDPNIIQRIVYDDEDGWSNADLNLLQLAGTLVPFSRSTDAFGKFTRMARA